MNEGKRESEEAEAGLKAAPGYHPQATEWIRVVCCGGMRSGSHDEISKRTSTLFVFFAHVLTARSASFCSQGCRKDVEQSPGFCRVPCGANLLLRRDWLFLLHKALLATLPQSQPCSMRPGKTEAWALGSFQPPSNYYFFPVSFVQSNWVLLHLLSQRPATALPEHLRVKISSAPDNKFLMREFLLQPSASSGSYLPAPYPPSLCSSSSCCNLNSKSNWPSLCLWPASPIAGGHSVFFPDWTWNQNP